MFGFGTFAELSFSSYTSSIFGTTWTDVNNSQTSSWNNVNNSQSTTWNSIDNSQSAGWFNVNNT